MAFPPVPPLETASWASDDKTPEETITGPSVVREERVKPEKVGEDEVAISCGNERVMSPVEEETLIWFAVPVKDKTPVLVIVTFVVPERDIPEPAVRREERSLYSKAVAEELTPNNWLAEPIDERPVPP